VPFGSRPDAKCRQQFEPFSGFNDLECGLGKT